MGRIVGEDVVEAGIGKEEAGYGVVVCGVVGEIVVAGAGVNPEAVLGVVVCGVVGKGVVETQSDLKSVV